MLVSQGPMDLGAIGDADPPTNTPCPNDCGEQLALSESGKLYCPGCGSSFVEVRPPSFVEVRPPRPHGWEKAIQSWRVLGPPSEQA